MKVNVFLLNLLYKICFITGELKIKYLVRLNYTTFNYEYILV
jgi:hypothetical protein